MRILHLQLLPLLSGVQRVTLNEILDFKGRGDYEFHVYCNSEGPLTDYLSDVGTHYEIVTSLKREISLIDDIKSLITLIKKMRENKFDVVHTHSSKTGVLGRLAAKICGVRNIVHTVHGYSFPAAKNKRQYYTFFLMEYVSKFFTDSLIVLNKEDYDLSVDKLGYSKDKVKLVVNAIDTDKFYPKTGGIDHHDCVRIVMVGRLWEQKNPMCLLEAFLQLPPDLNCRLDFIGEGELREQIEEVINVNNRNESIRILGWKDNVHDLLRNYDIFVLPSLWEGMPLAILEAQASGLPCIVSDIPGNNKLVIDSYNGFLFKSNDVIDLKEKLLNLINDSSLRRDMSFQARQNVECKYSMSARRSAIEEIYSEYRK